jgi:manganese/iron transport system permease protein
LRAVGNVLVVAMFVTPAATARLWVDEVGKMMALSSLLGALAGTIGLYISWHSDLAAGGVIVLTATCMFLATLVLSPRSGLLGAWMRRRPAAERATATL